MTEAEWLACTDPDEMAEFLRRSGRRVSDRRMWLLACASCRRISQVIANEQGRAAVEAAERYADGRVTDRPAHYQDFLLQLPRARGSVTLDRTLWQSVLGDPGWRVFDHLPENAMILKIITHLLIILPLSSQLDDILAASTPEPDDDILAAQDNDYLPAIHRIKLKESPNGELPFHHGLTARVSGSPALASAALLASAFSLLLLFSDPLYVLMSLQC
jgi:hypothetical protein